MRPSRTKHVLGESARTHENYKPQVMRTCGAKPACLVSASVTYCGNNQVYAFGGFDQYTDEGMATTPRIHRARIVMTD
jgi:hypothetical protein